MLVSPAHPACTRPGLFEAIGGEGHADDRGRDEREELNSEVLCAACKVADSLACSSSSLLPLECF
jgi:hypothetical protein